MQRAGDVGMETFEAAIPEELDVRIRKRVREALAAGLHGRSVDEEVDRLVDLMGLQDLDRRALAAVVADELRR